VLGYIDAKQTQGKKISRYNLTFFFILLGTSK